MNNVTLMGRLTADVELRRTQSGMSCCRFTIAVNRRFKNKQTGEYEADFISCQAWQNTAEFITRYFNKGSMIAVTGSIRTGSYQDKNHPEITHYTTDVIVENAEFCGSKNGNGQANTQPNYGGQPYNNQPYNNQQNYGNQQYSNQPNYGNQGNFTPQNLINNAQQQGISTGYADMSSYEEILSDGDTPF